MSDLGRSAIVAGLRPCRAAAGQSTPNSDHNNIICMYMYIYIYIYMYVYICTHIFTYVYIYIYI